MPRSLQDSYWATAAVVVLVLSPHIVVTTAYFLLDPHIAADLHVSGGSLLIAEGMANAGYAFAAGPLLAAPVVQVHAWRRLFGGFAALVLLVLVLAVFTLPDIAPPNPDLPFDAPAIGLGLGGTVLAFLAVTWLGSLGFGSPLFTSLLAAGVACLIALLVLEYRAEEPLSPVKPLSSTIPTVGTLAATIGGGAFVSLVLLTERYLGGVKKRTPFEVGFDFWPQVLGVLVAAVLLGTLVAAQ